MAKIGTSLTLIFLLLSLSPTFAQRCSSTRSTSWAQKTWNKFNPKKTSCKVDRLHLQVGLAGNYLYDRNTETGFDPQQERTNLMGEALLGLRFDHKGRKANVIGVWGSAGNSSPETVGLLLTEQGDMREVDMMTSSHRFYELEGGFLFREWFRISGGVGTQEFTDINGEFDRLEYFKVSTGLSIRLTKSIKWNTNAAFLFSEGSNTYSFRPSTGLAFRFNFLKV